MMDEKNINDLISEEVNEELLEAETEITDAAEEIAEEIEEAATEAEAEIAEVEAEAEASVSEEIEEIADVAEAASDDIDFEAAAAEAAVAVAEEKKAKKEKGMRISYERRKQLYGYGFIALWAVGTIYFFIMPLIKSLYYSFNNTAVKTGYMECKWIGLGNYIKAFRESTDYAPALLEVLGDTALKFPLITVFSIFVAVILNQKFRGRTFARAVFFLPVIIATGPVINIINGNMDTGGYSGGSEQFSTMFETDLVNELMGFLGVYNINEKLTTIIQTVCDEIFNLVWNAGIQILIFLAALQNIPHSAKEAAQMEGATGWEYFWKITIPYISPMIVTNVVYTIVDSFTDTANPVMELVLSQAKSWNHGYSAAMAWAYFGIVAAALAIIIVIINKFVYYEVE